MVQVYTITHAVLHALSQDAGYEIHHHVSVRRSWRIPKSMMQGVTYATACTLTHDVGQRNMANSMTHEKRRRTNHDVHYAMPQGMPQTSGHSARHP